MIDELSEVLKKALEVLGELRQVSKNASEQIILSQKEKEEAGRLMTALKAREVRITEKEHLIRRAEELDKGTSELETGQVHLANERKAFTEECAREKAKLDEQAADLAAREKNLAEKQSALEAEKASYKQKLLDMMGGEGCN